MNKRLLIGVGVLAYVGVVAAACGGGTVDVDGNDGGGTSSSGGGASSGGASSGGASSSGGTSSGEVSSSGGSSGGTSSGEVSSSGGTSSGGSSSGEGSSSGGSSGSSSGRVPENHRPTATPCDDVRPAGGAPDDDGECTTDADCDAGRNGRCRVRGGRIGGWACTYDACLTDAECAGNGVCECEGAVSSDANVCLSNVGCRVDADCGAGGFCSPSQGSCGNYSGIITYQCHTPQDECIDDADCEQGNCRFDDTAGHWKCSDSQCAG